MTNPSSLHPRKGRRQELKSVICRKRKENERVKKEKSVLESINKDKAMTFYINQNGQLMICIILGPREYSQHPVDAISENLFQALND